MARRVPLWVVGCLLICAWGLGRLLGAGTGSMAAVLLGSATVSLGGYAVVARYLRSLGDDAPENRIEPDDDSSDSLLVRATPTLAWAAAWGVVYSISGVDSWPDQPILIGEFRARELLAFTATLAVLPAVDRRATDFVLGRRPGRDARLRQEIQRLRASAPAANAPAAGEQVVVGWRWSQIALLALGSAMLVALGVLMMIEIDSSIVTKVAGGVLAASSTVVLVSTLFEVVRHPVALRIDGEGIELAERGRVPWSAVSSCSLVRVRGARRLVVNTSADSGAPWMTARLRRGGLTLPTGVLDIRPGQLALTLERFDHSPQPLE